MDTRTIAVIVLLVALVVVGIYYLAGPGSMTITETTPPAATAPETPPQTTTP